MVNVIDVEVGPSHPCQLAEGVVLVYGIVKHCCERRLQFGQCLGGGAGSGVLIGSQSQRAIVMFDWDDTFFEIAIFNGVGGSLLTLGRKAVDVAAAYAFFGGNHIG